LPQGKRCGIKAFKYCLNTKEIINTMNDGVMLISPDGVILMVNRALEEISGYSREELMGRSCSIFQCDICELSRSKGKGHWCGLFRVGHARGTPCCFVRKDGSYIHVLKNASLLKDPAKRVLGAVETVTDISEIDRREEQIQQFSRLLDENSSFLGILGSSPGMQSVFEIIRKVAQRNGQGIGCSRHPQFGEAAERPLYSAQLRIAQ
jgi:two-component system, NtrC family, response regulator HydG